MRKIVVIGAGAAGMAAATRARRVDATASITLLEASQEYARRSCSLPYYVSGEVPHRRELVGISREDLQAARIELRLGTPAAAIRAHCRRVVLNSGEELDYDRLIVSSGSRPRPLPLLAGRDGHRRLWRLRSVADADHLREGLAELRPSTVAIIGGGYLGLEMAEVFTRLGCRVTLFHRQSSLMRLLEPAHELVLAELSRHRITVRAGCEVVLINPDCQQRTIEFKEPRGERQAAGFDAVFMAAGNEPEATLLASAGARLGPRQGALVDSRGETTLAGVFAAGDGVEFPSGRGGASRYVPLATTAARLGRVCGENAAGGSLRMPLAHGCIAARLFSLQVASVGHPADWVGAEAHTVDFGSEFSTFPRRARGRATLLSEPGGGRLLGAQFVAPEATGLADAVSLALREEMTLRDLGELDSCYAPPLTELWHPFYLAARMAQKSRLGAWR